MKFQLTLAALLLTGCVMPGDMLALEARILERAAVEDKALLEIAQEEIAATRAEVEARTEGAIGELAKEGGALGGAALMAWHLYRNYTRKKVLPTTEGK